MDNFDKRNVILAADQCFPALQTKSTCWIIIGSTGERGR